MKTINIFFIVIILFLSNVKIHAQDITISSTDLVNLKNEVRHLKDSVEVLNKVIISNESIVRTKDDTIDKLTSQKIILQSKIDSIKKDYDIKNSLIVALQESEKSYQKQVQAMQETTERNIAKLANGRLFFKYSDKLVQPSILSLQKLQLEDVKKDFEQALTLLQNYKTYSEDVKQTLVAMQSIDRETWKSKHQADAYKNKSLTLLKQSAYYRNVYIKRDSGLWSIPYLDNLIDAAKSIIKKHNPVDSEYANFLPLIEML